MLVRDTLRQEIRRGAAGSIVYLLNDTAEAATFVVLSDAGAVLQASTAATVVSLGDPARTQITCPVAAISDAMEAAEVRISITDREDIYWPFDVVVRPYRAELVAYDDIVAMKSHAARVIEAQAQNRELGAHEYVDRVLAPIARKAMDRMVRAELQKQHGADREEFYRGSAIVDADRLFDVEVQCALTQLYESMVDNPEEGRAAQMAARHKAQAMDALQALGRIRLEPNGAPGADLPVMVRTVQTRRVQS